MKTLTALILLCIAAGCATAPQRQPTSRLQPMMIDDSTPALAWAATFGPGEPAPSEVSEERGILTRSWQWVQDNPGKTAAIIVGGYLVYEHVLNDDSDGGGNRDTIIISAGRDASVSITQTDRSNNDSSNRPSTAAPFFPPPAQ
jgi:hypothetical protein